MERPPVVRPVRSEALSSDVKKSGVGFHAPESAPFSVPIVSVSQVIIINVF